MRKNAIDQNQHPEGFQFTRRWFVKRNLATFRDYLMPEWSGKQMTYLEIGVFEGMSMVWMLQHVLTHPRSKAVGVDPWLMTTKLDSSFMNDVQNRARHNTKPWADRCQLWQANSAEILRRMGHKGFSGINKESVDVCMIDGDHNELAVLDDARLVFPLVKPGGWILFDDVENDRPKERHVKDGLRMFMEENDQVEEIWRHKYVVCLKKTDGWE